MKSDTLNLISPEVHGSYLTYKYDTKSTSWLSVGLHKITENELDNDSIKSFDPVQIASYYVIALLFGLIDNFDKNVSFRVFGSSKLLADFYDMDTALGLNNVGLENVSPTVGMKLMSNYRNSLEQDYPFETFNTKEVKPGDSEGDMYPKYIKLMPETYTNKLWLSLDTKAMRTLLNINYSLYTSLWFKLRRYLDVKAAEAGFSSVVDYFVDNYFKAQLNCGTFIYNYDYTIKYLNDYEQTG